MTDYNEIINSDDGHIKDGKVKVNPIPHRLMKYFNYEHLPPKLQKVSKLFHDLANEIDMYHAENDIAEKTTGLRKLLEAKDCIVRASL